ncbi:VpsR-related response regulator [Vibrio sp. ZSDZ34]|uniref:VpsR-related response regulator n=1 Tax=Vibrio gelatinilyticus TaxID=2893468 RepID=A0A9X1WB38_9VIBR|nr:VpsR-related response regulator [Vibrio gelatinilyticus]MCJ2375863.1 VpsR-related response regulator [Vibrio gelatinilyticus]
MGSEFRMDSIPGSLVVVGGTYEPWLSVLEHAGWRCTQCSDLRKADSLFSETGPCIGIVDLTKDDFSLNGIAKLVSSHKQVRWIAFIREEQLSSDTICQFIVNFCIDFFTTPIPDSRLMSTIGHQLGMLKLEQKVWPHNNTDADLNIIGQSLPARRMRDQIRRIGPTDVSIMIHGEVGCGKETVAKAIHRCSSRSQKPFISVNCRAFSDERFENEFFGMYDSSKPSLLSQAQGGTVLLNDIFTLPAKQQMNLLKLFQDGQIETAKGAVEFDVRILAADSSDIDRTLGEGIFNDELFHCINVLRINVPSLKERATDIALLVNHYMGLFAKEFNAPVKSIDDDALKTLSYYHWPGNIKELINQVKRAVLMSESEVLLQQHFELPGTFSGKRSLKSIRERSERDALILVLDSHSGQVTLAAKELGISRATMYRLLNKHNLITEESVQ